MSEPRVIPFIEQRCEERSALSSLRALSTQGEDAKMADIPAGTFQMGGDPQAALAECQKYDTNCLSRYFQDEAPIHAVALDAFEIDKYEVTNAEYATCVAAKVCSAPAANGSYLRGNYYDDPTFANYPVIFVNWYDSNIYCAWRGTRLPSETEWEYAARGGLRERLYPWGDESPDCSLVNFWPKGDFACIGDTTLVGSYAPNGYGLYDMAGNVREWVYDWYDAYPGANVGENNDFGRIYRVLRGGSWGFPARLSVSNRDGDTPNGSSNNAGFRCVR